jgi:glycogen(starch) synthase
MKILMFTPYFQKEYGSHEYYLVKHLVKLGHEVILATSKHPYPKYNSDYKKTSLGNEKFEGAEIKRLESSFDFKGVPFLKNIENLIKREKPDVVHVHDHFQHYSYKIAKMKSKYSFRLILTQHLYKFPKKKIFAPLFFFIDRLFGARVLKDSDRIIVLGDPQKNFIEKKGNYSGKMVEIPTGIDTNIFKKVENNLKKEFGIGDEKVILSVTRFTPHKDVQTLIYALDYLKKIDFKCIIVATGPLEKDIKKKITALNLGEKIIIRHFVNQKDLPKYYSIADVMVLPSIEEPFGIVLLESLSCETPVVGSDLNAIKGIINDDVGYTFPPKDYVELGKKISLAIKNQKALKRKARKYVKDKYSWEKIAKLVERTYIQ